jgi:hypothetical protein
MVDVEFRADVRRLIADHPDLAERYRQATVNHQVADLLDVRALRAGTAVEARNWRYRAAQRRQQGDQILQQVLGRLEERVGGTAGPSRGREVVDSQQLRRGLQVEHPRAETGDEVR